jgi:hypothetical protein
VLLLGVRPEATGAATTVTVVEEETEVPAAFVTVSV